MFGNINLSIHVLIVGETDPIVLEFDHRNKETKTDCVSTFVNPPNFSGLAKEIEKCDIRCCNCHARKTSKQEGYHLREICGVSYETIDSFPDNMKYSEERKRKSSQRNNFRKKIIERIDMITGEIKEYESLHSVEKDGFWHTAVSLCCREKQMSHKGYWWAFNNG